MKPENENNIIASSSSILEKNYIKLKDDKKINDITSYLQNEMRQDRYMNKIVQKLEGNNKKEDMKGASYENDFRHKKYSSEMKENIVL